MRGVPRGGGFTLVELVIALTLIAIMAVLLFSGLRLGARSWDAVERRAERDAEVRAVVGFLTNNLRQLHPVVRVTPEGSDIVFAGTASVMEYVAPLSAFLGLGGLYIQRLELRRTAVDYELVLTYWLYHPEVMDGEADVPLWKSLRDRGGSRTGDFTEGSQGLNIAFGQRVLLDAVEGFNLAYYGSAVGETEGSWRDSWDDPARMPQALRLRIALGGGWLPEIYVALPGASDANAGMGTGVIR
jgi:general secretion pathway protein J